MTRTFARFRPPATGLPARLGLAALLLIAAAGPAAGQTTYTWTANATGLFDVTTNWQGGVAPALPGDPGDTLRFLVSGATTTTVTATNNLGGELTANRLVFVNRGAGTFTLARATDASFALAGADPAIAQDGNGAVTISSPLSIASDITLGGTGLGVVTISGALTGDGGLIIPGGAPTANTRVFDLINTNTTTPNTFTGAIVLDGGNLEASAAASLGSGVFTVTPNGGNFTVGGTITNPSRAFDIQAGAGLTLLGSSSITFGSATAGAGVTTLSGAGPLFNRSTGTVTVAVDSGLSGAVTSDLNPTGTTPTGPGTITLSGADGALRSVPEFNLRAAAGLTLTSSATGAFNPDRVGDSAAINLFGGVLSLTGAASNQLVENVGPITGAGYSTLTAGISGSTTAGTGTARYTALRADSLTRVDRGTFLLRGSAGLGVNGPGGAAATASGGIVFDTSLVPDLVGGGGAAGSTTISILPYAFGGNTTGSTVATTTAGFVTYDPVLGVRPLVVPATGVTGEYATTLASGTTTANNVRLALSGGAAVNLAGPTTVNSLLIASAPTGSVALTGAGPLTVTSGAVAAQAATAIDTPLAFGSREANIFTGTNGLTINGALTGTNGLTKSGTTLLALTGNNAGLTGPLTINGGQITVNSAAALPGTGAVVVYGADGSTTGPGVVSAAAGALTIGRDFSIRSGFLNLRSTTAAAPVTYAGVISGSGGVYVSTTGDVALTGTNTYSGPTRLDGGNLVISSDANLGAPSSALGLAATTTTGLVLAGDWTTGRAVTVNASTLINTNEFDATLNGLLIGASQINKGGSGRLEVTTASPFDGTVVVNANGGDVRLSGAGALNTGTYTLNAGGSLTLDGATAPVDVNRVGDLAAVNLAAGGTLRLVGSPSRPVFEQVGTVTAGNNGSVVEVTAAGGATATLVINNLVTTNASVVIRGTNLGMEAGSVGRILLNQINSTAITLGQTLPNTFAEDLNDPGVVVGAVYDANPLIGVRRVADSDFTSGLVIQNAAPTNTPTNANFLVRADLGGPVRTADAANTIASLRVNEGATLGASSGTLTVSTGTFLTASGAAPATIAGGTLTSGIATGTTNQVLAFGVNAPLNLNAALAGNNGLAKNGLGTLTLGTASPNLTGTVTVNAGTLALGTSGALAAATPNNLVVNAAGTFALNGFDATVGTLSPTTNGGTIALGANTLTFGSTTSTTFSGVITGTGRLVKVGTVTQTLTGANTFSGGLTINSGTVSVADTTRLGTGAVTLNGGILSYSGTVASAPLAGLVIAPTGGTLTATSATTGAGLTLPAAFAWNGTLTKAGSGRVIASADIGTTQTLNLTAGTFATNGFDLTVGGLTGTTGTVDVGDGTFTVPTASFPISVIGDGGRLVFPAGTTVFNPTGTAQTIGVNLGGDLAVNYTPGGTTFAGTLTLGGDNTYTGGTAGPAGARYNVLRPTGFGTGPVTLRNEDALTSAVNHLQFTFGTGVSGTVANDLNLSTLGGVITRFDVNSSSSVVTLAGRVTGGAPPDTSSPDGVFRTVLELDGVSGATTGTAFKFTNPANDFQQTIEVSTGTLVIGNVAAAGEPENDALGNPDNDIRLATGLSTTSRAGLRFDTPLTLQRTVIVRTGGAVNTQGFDVTFAGPLTDSVIPSTSPGGNPTVGRGTLTKLGSGTLTLANAANTATGPVVVTEGRLSVTGQLGAGDTATNNRVTVSGAGTLQGTGSVGGREVLVNTGGTLQGGVGAAAGTLSTGAVVLDGLTTLRTVVGEAGGSQIAVGGTLTRNTTGTATDRTTIFLVNDGSLTVDATTTYTRTVATFSSTTLTAADFTLAADFAFRDDFAFDLSSGTSLVVTFTPVPEPATVLAVGAAGLGLVRAVRRRVRRSTV